MNRLRMLADRVLMFLRHRQIEAELEEEIQNHLEMHEDHLRHSGLDPEEEFSQRTWELLSQFQQLC